MSTPGIGELTEDRLLARNTLLNLLGQGLPLVFGLVAIPVLVGAIGAERFGVLAIAWMVIGYFSLFDLGLGRSLTQIVSDRLGQGRPDEVPFLAWTALALMAGLGLTGGGVLWLLTPVLVGGVLNVPPPLVAETEGAFRILALTVPFVVATTGLRGLLAALQRFGYVNAVRIPLGASTYLAPLLVLPFSRSLVPIVAVLAAARVAAWAAYLVLCFRALPSLLRRTGVRPAEIGGLLSFGGWVTVSNVVGPLMVYFDRFLIGALLTMTAVAHYVTPFEVLTRLSVIPAAVAGVFLPAFATTFRAAPERTARLFDRSSRTVLILVFPPLLVLTALAPEGLELWVGADFAREGAPVARWLAAGVFVNALAQIPFGLLQGMGRPDLPARLHLLEAPLYGLLLWILLESFGIVGAAAAWTVRTAVDGALLFGLSGWLLPECRAALLRLGAWSAVCLALLGAVVWPVGGLSGRLLLLVGFLAGFGVAAWRWILEPRQRGDIRRLLARLGPASG